MTNRWKSASAAEKLANAFAMSAFLTRIASRKSTSSVGSTGGGRSEGSSHPRATNCSGLMSSGLPANDEWDW